MYRVAVYIDGFNLYYGLKSAYGRQYLWLDLEALAGRLIKPGYRLETVSYFTAERHPHRATGEKRQAVSGTRATLRARPAGGVRAGTGRVGQRTSPNPSVGTYQ